jgi:hypothetical protein
MQLEVLRGVHPDRKILMRVRRHERGSESALRGVSVHSDAALATSWANRADAANHIPDGH